MAQDGLEQLANQFRQYWEFCRRILKRGTYIALFILLGAAISIAVALNLPRIYESRTLISYKVSVDKRRVFSTTDFGNESSWLKPRLEEFFSSHTTMMKIINEVNLFASMRNSAPPEEILKEFSSKARFGLVGSDTFWISFEYKNPRKAQKAAQRLAEEFIKSNIQDRIGSASATLTFMAMEVKKAKQELNRIDGEIAQFAAEHPEYQIDPITGMTRGMTSTTRDSHSKLRYSSVKNAELRRLLMRKGHLEAQLQLSRNPQTDSDYMRSKQSLERARRRLFALKRKYTPQHPDVLRAQQVVNQLRLEVNYAKENRRTKRGGEGQLRQEIVELDQSIARLSRKLERRQKRHSTSKKKSNDDEDDNAGGLGISSKARIEKKFYQLTRDREVAKAKYEQLNEQLVRTRLSSNIEEKEAETQFVIIDKANLPRKPVRPSRTKLVLAGTAIGTLLGLGLAVLLVIFDPRIYCEDDLKKVCDLPVMAQIPKEKEASG